MKKLIVLTFLLTSTAHAAANLDNVSITSIDTRNNGYQAIYIDQTIPDVPCELPTDRMLTDRIIINESDVGAKTMISVALFAISSGSKVSLRVDGCEMINPDGQNLSAPKLVRLSIQ